MLRKVGSHWYRAALCFQGNRKAKLRIHVFGVRDLNQQNFVVQGRFLSQEDPCSGNYVSLERLGTCATISTILMPGLP